MTKSLQDEEQNPHIGRKTEEFRVHCLLQTWFTMTNGHFSRIFLVQELAVDLHSTQGHNVVNCQLDLGQITFIMNPTQTDPQ